MRLRIARARTVVSLLWEAATLVAENKSKRDSFAVTL